MSYREKIKELIEKILKKCIEFYGDRLVSFVVFGSVARGTNMPASDIDIMIVAENLPAGRLKRVSEFTTHIENSLEAEIDKLQKSGIYVSISPIIKTPDEVQIGSPLFLDMIYDSMILYDRSNFFKNTLKKLQEKLEKLGSVRIKRANAWFWVLKPDYKYGEKIEL